MSECGFSWLLADPFDIVVWRVDSPSGEGGYAERADVIQEWEGVIDGEEYVPEVVRLVLVPIAYAGAESLDEIPAAVALVDSEVGTFDNSTCPACGSSIDYCQGHGELGDPTGAAILAAHGAGDHSRCHPLAVGCGECD